MIAKELGDRRMSDVKVRLVISSTSVESYTGRIFSPETDPRMKIVDAVMASAAAPIYFPPSKPEGEERSYYDGGLWANDPSEEAIRYCRSEFGAGPEDVRLVSIGNGRYATGSMAGELARMHPVSLPALRVLLDLSSSLQTWHTQRLIGERLKPEHYVLVNSELVQPIALDDATTSIALLPALADEAFARFRPRVQAVLSAQPAENDALPLVADPIAVDGIAAAGMTRFTPSRKHYARYRIGRESITAYCASAMRTLSFISINLKTGHNLESILDTFRSMIIQRPIPVQIKLSLLNPEYDFLMKSVCGNMGISDEELSTDVRRLIARVTDWHAGLPRESRGHFHFYLHNTIPSASAIIIDENETYGTLQLETGAYRAPTIESFGFELRHGSELFATLQRAYNRLIADANRIL